MKNLFSIFDPSTSLYFSFNWMSLLFNLILLPMFFWLIPSRLNYFWLLIFYYLNKEFKILLNKTNFFNSMILISLFMYILLNNFFSLFPYIFATSSHMTFTLTLSLLFWLTFMIMSWFKNLNHMFTHLTPQGTPMILVPLMILIETTSNLIRPGTLAVRLSANIIAGHLIITLISNNAPKLNFNLMILLIFVQYFLFLLEIMVSIIQAYVFMILTTIYSSETN
uniref:ATP synthase subunit a n=1 Tax=Pelecinus polyturator TaxID=44352 RepID=A0A0E3ELL7_9HYME|nr:ATP synthase F0 subunit 6 [Pelecinus polyturator]AIW82470.1 ATP synthase F0 subunit 6 [Pelecinus polyturator]